MANEEIDIRHWSLSANSLERFAIEAYGRIRWGFAIVAYGRIRCGDFAGETAGKFAGEFAGSGLYKKGSQQWSFSLALPGSEEGAL